MPISTDSAASGLLPRVIVTLQRADARQDFRLGLCLEQEVIQSCNAIYLFFVVFVSSVGLQWEIFIACYGHLFLCDSLRMDGDSVPVATTT